MLRITTETIKKVCRPRIEPVELYLGSLQYIWCQSAALWMVCGWREWLSDVYVGWAMKDVLARVG